MVLEPLIKDFPEQFKNKRNIEVLANALDKQFAELFGVFLSLQTELTLDRAIGKQLDGIGDIVGLTRYDAAGLAASSETVDTLDDENYRKMLLYKILKNNCDCSFYDVMKAVDMFWNGPTLKYTEDSKYPATIVFDFEASKDLGEQSFDIPFVKAGGVGMFLRMHKNDDATIYMGLALQSASNCTYECNVPVLEQHTYLTDIDDVILTDELKNWLADDEEEAE